MEVKKKLAIASFVLNVIFICCIFAPTDRAALKDEFNSVMDPVADQKGLDATSGGTGMPRRPSKLDHEFQTTLAISGNYLERYGAPLILENGKINGLVLETMGLSDIESEKLKQSLNVYLEEGKKLEKTHSHTKVDRDGNSILVIEPFQSEMEKLDDILTHNIIGAVGVERARAIEILVRKSEPVRFGDARKELYFTERDRVPVLRLTALRKGREDIVYDMELADSSMFRNHLRSKFGHLIDTDASLTQMKEIIMANDVRTKESLAETNQQSSEEIPPK